MTAHHPKLGSVEVTLTARTLVRKVPQIETEIPGGLVPLVARHYEIDEYRLLMGWPQPIPSFDARTVTEAVVLGEAVTFRPEPESIMTKALHRWTASSGYDPTALRWRSLRSSTPDLGSLDMTLVTSHIPAKIDNYEYRIHDERFHQSALVFDADDQSYINLDLGIFGFSSAITVVMVCSPSPPTGAYAGLFSNSNTSGYFYKVIVQGQYLYLRTDRNFDTSGRGPAINPALNSNNPFYIALVLMRPTSMLYAGQGPSSFQVSAVEAGSQQVVVPSQFTIGRDPADLTHNISMALLDFSIYPNALTSDDVAVEFATLSQVYGGDS